MFNRRTYMRVAAWVLLVAYLPLLVASAVHTHRPSRVEVCDQCVHHVAHASHVDEAAVSMQHCLACHLLSFAYFGVAVPAVAVPLAAVRVRACRAVSMAAVPLHARPLRGPPVC